MDIFVCFFLFVLIKFSSSWVLNGGCKNIYSIYHKFNIIYIMRTIGKSCMCFESWPSIRYTGSRHTDMPPILSLIQNIISTGANNKSPNLSQKFSCLFIISSVKYLERWNGRSENTALHTPQFPLQGLDILLPVQNIALQCVDFLMVDVAAFCQTCLR